MGELIDRPRLRLLVNSVSLSRRAVIVALYAIAMGYLEAVVVYYIRYALGDIHAILGQTAKVLAFPWGIEATREIATIVMLATVALLAGRTQWEKLAAFLWAFAIWDAIYYGSLKVLTQWPPSLTTQDVYFLLPVPWGGPVWVPLLCDVLMVLVAGFLVSPGWRATLARTRSGRRPSYARETRPGRTPMPPTDR